MDLKSDFFLPVAKRIRERADSLREIQRFPRSGIEAWLKVEAVAALGRKVKAIKNRGPDLVMHSGERIELKAATDLNVSDLRKGAIRYNTPCLILGDGHNSARIGRLSGNGIRLAECEVFSDGSHQWVLGLLVPDQNGAGGVL